MTCGNRFIRWFVDWNRIDIWFFRLFSLLVVSSMDLSSAPASVLTDLRACCLASKRGLVVCVCVCKISTSSLPSRLLITGYVFIKRRPRVWLFSLSITDFTALRWQGNAAIIPPNETVPLISVIFHPILQFVVIVLIFFSIEWKILHSFFLLFFKKEKNPVRYLKGGKSKIKEKRDPLAILSGLLCWLAAQRSARMPASKQQQQQHPLDV